MKKKGFNVRMGIDFFIFFAFRSHDITLRHLVQADGRIYRGGMVTLKKKKALPPQLPDLKSKKGSDSPHICDDGDSLMSDCM